MVGLGNQGQEHKETRHNVGFMVIDRLASRLGIVLGSVGNKTIWGSGKAEEVEVILAKPLAYVNLSGQSIDELLVKFAASPAGLLVIHDDLDLPRGVIRVKKKGGSGGHNGLKSIIGSLQTGDFGRVRIGIGRPPGRQDPARFVLSPFTKRQWAEMDVALEQAADAVVSIITEGIESAMNTYNK